MHYSYCIIIIIPLSKIMIMIYIETDLPKVSCLLKTETFCNICAQ